MEKRIILFLLLSFGIIFGFDFFLKELGLMPEPPPSEEGREASPTGYDPLSPTGSIQDASSDVRPHGDGPETALHRGHNLEEIETPLYRATFTNRGAQIQSWKLKQYLTQDEDDPQPIEFIYPEGHFAGPVSMQVADPCLLYTSDAADE